jgi:hypothetical protein
MAKIKNFGLITLFDVKMYCNLRNLTSRVVFSFKILNRCNALASNEMRTKKLPFQTKSLSLFASDRLLALKFCR